MIEPSATVSPLTRSDGSAQYNCPTTGFQILGSVNGPIELPGRRDAQKPEEATLEVFVKPATAQSAIGERYVEGILKTLLGKIVLGREKGFARRGVVITLLILGGLREAKVGRGESYLPALPALLHAALLALLSAGIPLSMTYTAAILAVSSANKITPEPSLDECAKAKSLHVLAFSSKGHLLLNESQGTFDFGTWEQVYDQAISICREKKVAGKDGDVAMDASHTLEAFLRETVEEKISQDYAWSNTGA